MGANILTKYAGEEGEDCALKAIVVLANPWNFVYGHHWLPSTFIGRNVYRYALGGALRTLLHFHRRVFLEAPDLPISRQELEDVFRKRAITLGQYDHAVTSPLYGFKGPVDYYRRISSSRVMTNIQIPCLAINAADDPIIGPGCFPIAEVRVHLQPRGGSFPPPF